MPKSYEFSRLLFVSFQCLKRNLAARPRSGMFRPWNGSGYLASVKFTATGGGLTSKYSTTAILPIELDASETCFAIVRRLVTLAADGGGRDLILCGRTDHMRRRNCQHQRVSFRYNTWRCSH